MAEKRTPLSITCEVNPFLQIVLMNVRKVFGHDDSLPFNAEVYVRKDNGILTHVANAWNDGWGGETNIDPISKDVQPLLIEAECEVEKRSAWSVFVQSTFIACGRTDGERITIKKRYIF